MKTAVKFVIGLVVIVAIIGGFLFYLGQDLDEVSLESFDLRGIEDISANSFTLDGNLYVRNPSNLPVPVESVVYDVYLKETGERIGSGTISSFTLDNNQVNQISFNQEVQWVPAAQLAIDLATQDEVMVEVEGELRLNLPEVENHAILFSDETDIKSYIVQFVPELPADNVVNNVI